MCRTCFGDPDIVCGPEAPLLNVPEAAVVADPLLENMSRICEENGCRLETDRVSKPNYFPRENPVVDALTDVYNELTGSRAEPYVMGGGTYARKLPDALGYGMGGLPKPESGLFGPGHGGAHQCDEGLYLPGLKKAMVIFAMGLLEADRILDSLEQ